MTLRTAIVALAWNGEPSGAGRRLLALVDAIAPRLSPGEEVVVLVQRGGVPENPVAGVRWVPVDVPAGPTWRRALAERRRLPRLLGEIGARVADFGTLPVPPGLPCRSCLTLHDVRDLDGWQRRPRWLARHALTDAIRRVDAIITPSHFSAARLRDALRRQPPPITVVPNGVDRRFLDATPRARPAQPYFLHVGHLEPRKNLLLALSALGDLVERFPGDPDRAPRLVLAGADHGGGETLHERAALLGLAGHVDFAGVVAEDTLLDLYTRASAVLVPSQYEGFGLPALEGLAVGTPVLAADCSALPEVVGDAATLLPEDDARAWSDAMLDCLEPTTEDAVNARKDHASRYSWDLAAADTLTVWRDLANRD